MQHSAQSAAVRHVQPRFAAPAPELDISYVPSCPRARRSIISTQHYRKSKAVDGTGSDACPPLPPSADYESFGELYGFLQASHRNNGAALGRRSRREKTVVNGRAQLTAYVLICGRLLRSRPPWSVGMRKASAQKTSSPVKVTASCKGSRRAYSRAAIVIGAHLWTARPMMPIAAASSPAGARGAPLEASCPSRSRGGLDFQRCKRSERGPSATSP